MFGKMLCSAALAATLAMPAWAESTTTAVQFAPGVTGTAATGQISGRDTADFTIAGRAGQKLRIEMISDHPSSAFDIYAPGATPGQSPALFTGAGKRADLTLPSDGTYMVRTYLAPGAENASARFSLTIDLGGSGNTGNAAPPAATATTAATTAPTAMAGTAAQTASSPAGMQDGGPDYWRVTGIEGRLNIRADASTGADIIATAGNGDSLRNLGCKTVDARTWCQVETVTGGARTGWAANQFLREGPVPGQADGQTPAAATRDTPPTASAVSAKRPVANPAIAGVPPRAAPAAPADASAPRTSSVVSAAKPAPKPSQKDSARGNLPCSTALGMPTRDCAFTVVRVGGGDAAVKISRPDGSTRNISFVKGAPAPLDGQRTERRGDLTVINIGNERYEIPDAVIFGG